MFRFIILLHHPSSSELQPADSLALEYNVYIDKPRNLLSTNDDPP